MIRKPLEFKVNVWEREPMAKYSLFCGACHHRLDGKVIFSIYVLFTDAAAHVCDVRCLMKWMKEKKDDWS